jgi:hypothetical protein
MTGGRVAGAATLAIVALWGGILVIATIERRLPDPQQWYGHAAVHLWTSGNAAIIAAAGWNGLRSQRVPEGLLRPLVGAGTALATIAAVAGILDAIGAHPTLRGFHDRVNAVAAPTGWLLLASLVAILLVGLNARRPASSNA